MGKTRLGQRSYLEVRRQRRLASQRDDERWIDQNLQTNDSRNNSDNINSEIEVEFSEISVNEE